jgi:arylsulfatase A-like enzyme
MNSNVLFLVIDSLRSDKFYGKSKTSITPNIDSLIKKGTYFSQAVSVSDVTGKSVGSMVTGMYPFKTGMGNRRFNPNTETIFDILKKNEYHIYATVPNLTWFNQLTKKFDSIDNYFCAGMNHDGLSDKVGTQILKRLTSKQMKEPWIYYIHLVDLHDKIRIPPEFNKEEFGDTQYEKMLSYIDGWIGKIVNHIDLEKTLVVITADHGDYIPIVENVGIPRIQSFMKKGKYFFPKLEPIGIKLFIVMRNIDQFFKQRKLKKELTPEQLRTVNTRGGKKVLYDETLRIPLLVVGNGMPSKKLDNLVSTLDVSPTILNHIGLKMNNSSIDGRNLETLINENNIHEDPIFIESGDTSEHEGGFVIGVRTSKFKYFKTVKNPEKNRHLYDLQADPLEMNNLVDSKQDIVASMEGILKKFHKQTTTLELEEDENTKKIEEELKKLGYI